MSLIDAIRQRIIAIMRLLARWLNAVTRGRANPDVVTIIGVVMHVPIAFLIASGHHNAWAALLLLVFGLFDKLDGELARLQKRDSQRGMLLDASTDRFKEVFLYTGIAYVLAGSAHPHDAAWAVLALGVSLCVSYVKAKGEAAVAAGKQIPHATLNRMFADGLMSFEIRMTVLIFGLLFNQLLPVVILIAVVSSFTALKRLVIIGKVLS